MTQDRATSESVGANNGKTPPRRLEKIIIWPHRSLSSKGFTIVIGILAIFLLIIGVGFLLAGAWPVMGFLGLELLIVWGAFKLNYRAARHHETILTTTEDVTVETHSPSGRNATKSFPLGWLRVKLSPSTAPAVKIRQNQKIILSSHGKQIEIGKHLHPAEKSDLSRDIDAMIDRARASRDAN